MSESEIPREQRKAMPCGYLDKSATELEAEGWEQDYSFHASNGEQWNLACDRVSSIKAPGGWEVGLVQGQSGAERRDSVTYVYKRRIE